MPTTITGVPERIARSEYLRLIQSVGLSTDHLISLEFGSRSITAKVYALNGEGQRYGTRVNGKSVPAIHSVVIEVDWSE